MSKVRLPDMQLGPTNAVTVPFTQWSRKDEPRLLLASRSDLALAGDV